MSVRRRQSFISQLRVDVPHLRSIESATSNDFDELLSALVTGISKSYVVRGLEISMSGAIGSSANGLQLIVANSAILHGTSNVSGTFYSINNSAPNQTLSSITNTRVSGSFTPSALNYIGIELTRSVDNTTASQVYLWNPTSKNEITKTLPLAEVLDYKIVITSSVFASNVLPIAIIETDSANNVLSVEDRRPLLFRLGTAGYTTPDPFYVYPWTNHSEGRTENFYKSSSSAVSPFRGGDKQISNLKEMLDAITSSLKEVKGTTYWYSLNKGGSIFKLRTDLANLVVTGRAALTHSATTAGRLNWNKDIFLNLVGSRLKYKISANPSSSYVVLADDQVAYIKLIRGVDITPNLIFTNGSATVSSVGSVAWTANVLAGDFIKKAAEDDGKYYKILSVNSASQVTLTENFAETSTGLAGADAQYAWGTYSAVAAPSTDRHIKVVNRKDMAIEEDVFWLFARDDNGTVGQEVSQVVTLADTANSLDGTYFLLNANDDIRKFYVWYDTGSNTDPAISGKTGIKVAISTNDSANTVAAKTQAVINTQPDFSASVIGNTVSITNVFDGDSSDISDGDTGFSFLTTTQGGKPKVYVRFVGSEVEQGETRQTSDNTNYEIMLYTGMKSEADSAPDYTNAIDNLTPEVVTITLPSAASITSGQYFTINSAGDVSRYYVWFNKDGAGGDPLPVGKIGIQVAISTGNSNLVVAAATASAILSVLDFSVLDNLNGTITVSNNTAGYCTNAANVNVGGSFSIVTDIEGAGHPNYFLVDGEDLTKSNKRLDQAINTALSGFDHEAYDELLTIVSGSPANDNEVMGPISASTILTIPLDSRSGNIVKGYIVGQAELEVYLNGQYLAVNNSWAEVGASGSESVQIQILIDLVVDDVLTFRIDNGTLGNFATATGEVNTGSNVGTGAGVFKTKAGVDLQFRTLKQGSNVTIVQTADELTISSSAGTGVNNIQSVVGTDFTILASHDFIKVTNSGVNVTLTLPDASLVTGKEYKIKKIDSGNILYIESVSNQTLDGVDITASPHAITIQYESLIIVSDGSSWWVL